MTYLIEHYQHAITALIAAGGGAFLLWSVEHLLLWKKRVDPSYQPSTTETDLRADNQDLYEALERSREEAAAWRDKYYEALQANLETQEKLLAYRILQGIENTEEQPISDP